MNIQTCLISLVLISIPLLSHGATYYKWIDEDGNVQYSQTRPKQVETEKIKVNAHTPENRSTYKRPSLNSAKKDAGSKTDKDPKGEEPENKLTEKERKQGCAEARAKLATLTSRGQIRQRNDKGETRYLSEEEKKASIKSTQELIDINCK